MFMLQLEI